MSTNRRNSRKQPLMCLTDPDILETPEITEEKPDLMLPLKKRKNGKENNKRVSTKSTPEVKNKAPKILVESDSDSDFEDLLKSLKKSGIKTEVVHKRKSETDSPELKANGKPKPDSTKKSNQYEASPVLKSNVKPKPDSTKKSNQFEASPVLKSNVKPKPDSTKKSNQFEASPVLKSNAKPKLDSTKKSNQFEASPVLKSSAKLRPDSTKKSHQVEACSVTKSRRNSKKESPWTESEAKTEEIRKSNAGASPGIKSKEARKRLFSDHTVTPVKRQGKRTHSNVSEKSDDSLEYITPLKKLQLDIQSTQEQLNLLQKQSEKTPRRKRAISVDSEDSVTPAKKQKTAALPITPLTKIAKQQKCETPRTPLEEARVSLHVSSVPNSLPCREQEYKNILNFVESKLYDGVGGCMYISGVPGTGKTATVTQVIRHLQKESVDGDLPAFQYVEINGMRLSDPRQAYVQLYQTIFGKKERISTDSAHKKLDAYFNKAGGKKTSTVILVDELDLMCTRKQDVVYNLLDWPSKPRSRLVVLTIANTMDMPERKLKGRVNSRLGLTRLTFLPYTHKQLEEIIMARLQGTEAFVLDAVRLATRKVAAVSGDARRALDICRRAAELPKETEPVRITHIEQAIKEMTNSNIVRFIRSCSEVEKMFLKSVSDINVRTGLEEVDFLQVIEHLLPLCVLEGLPKPPMPSVLSICNRLCCFRLLFTNSPKGGILQRLTLNITQDDLHYAFKTDEL